MILITLIKKEIMQFFRDKSNVLVMFIFPVFLIVVMGCALNGLMNVDYNIFENKKVYYKINDLSKENKYYKVFNSFKDSCEETIKIEFKEINDDNKAKEYINRSQGLAFINIHEDKFDFYRNEKKENDSQKIFRSVFEQYIEKYILTDTIISKNPNIINDLIKESNIKIKEEGTLSNGINSFTYYTFAELVLIILYISQITCVSTYKESFQGTLSRLRISKISNFKIIISKVILGIIVGLIQILVVYFISRVFLNVNWGQNLLKTLLVLISLIIFSSVLGITTSIIFKDNKTSSSLINTLLIILGFLGGSYVPISLVKSIKITNILCKMTPTYWANISLLSQSLKINTNYFYISISLSLGLSALLIIIGVLGSKVRLGDYND